MKSLESFVISHPALSSMKPEHLALLCKNAREMEFQPDEIIFQQGAPANRFFLIQSGKIILEAHQHDRSVEVQTLAAGELVGWSWLFPPFSWNLQARAVEQSNLIVLDGAHLLVTCEEDHDFGYELMKRISQIVINRLQATRQQLVEHQSEIGIGL